MAGKNNIPADFLSRIETVDFPNMLDYEKLQLHRVRPRAKTSYSNKDCVNSKKKCNSVQVIHLFFAIHPLLTYVIHTTEFSKSCV